MRRHARALVLALLLAAPLAGCATGPTFEQRMATFVGRSEADLVATLGVPVRTYETGGRRFLQFEQRATVLVPGDPWGFGPWGFGPPWGYRRPWAVPPSYAVVGCDLTFALREGRVESFTARGQGCG